MASKHKKKSNPVKVGIIGLGRAGYGMHCEELEPRQDKFQIVAGCDPLESKRTRFAERIKGAQLYKTIDELLADPEIELVDIANRTIDHFTTTLMALKSGKDVFLEKPICETIDEARRLKRATTKASGKLYIRHNRRFEKAFVHIQEIIASGILGDVYEIKLARHNFSRRDDWQTLRACGGGQLNNWGPHIIDHALRFIDGPVKEVWSDLKQVVASGDAEDHLKIIIKGRNGMVVDLEISSGVAIPSPVYAVYGTRGALVSYDQKTIRLRYLDRRRKLKPRRATKTDPGERFGSEDNLKWVEKEIPVKPKQKLTTFSIWDFLYDSIRDGQKFPITLDQSIEVMKIVNQVKAGTKYTRRTPATDQPP